MLGGGGSVLVRGLRIGTLHRGRVENYIPAASSLPHLAVVLPLTDRSMLL
jgi:hypothetical protein